jgi:alkylglycerol monooxygenase
LNINPIVLSIPVFFILIGIELLVERFTHQKLYRLQDSIANISCGITSQLSGLFLSIFGIGIYQLLFEKFAIFTLERTTWWYWIALILLVDFAYYWAHRMSHEVNLFWGGHVVHHQSEEYNLSVALRQSSLQVIWTFAFNLPIALLGFQTLDFVLVAAFNTLYQFWIHTETIGKLPRWIELIFNTPSHHRVHHGRNPKYIDRNHAGSLIIWDRMFGTFQAEEEKPTYGITKPLKSYLKRIPPMRDKLKYLFMKPGWLPDYLGGYRPAPEVDPVTFKKYDTPSPLSLNLYVLFHYLICLGGTALFLFNAEKFSLAEQGFITVLITITVVNCGVLFEQRKWIRWSEWARIFIYPLILSILTVWLNWQTWFHGLSLLYFLTSFIWFYSLQRQHEQLQMA